MYSPVCFIDKKILYEHFFTRTNIVFQEKSIRLESENHTLQADLKSEKDNANREVHELKLTINELKSQHENERHYLIDNLAQVTDCTSRIIIYILWFSKFSNHKLYSDKRGLTAYLWCIMSTI